MKIQILGLISLAIISCASCEKVEHMPITTGPNCK